MELTVEQYKKIAHYLPVKRSNIKLTDFEVLKAILYIAEQGCKWRGLPAHIWATGILFYTCMEQMG